MERQKGSQMASARITVDRRRNKPSYSIHVRLGLDTIAFRTHPRDQYERAAIQWIVDMRRWYLARIEPEHVRQYARKLAKKNTNAA